MTNPYLDLTAQFNRGRRRALVSSGQAVVLHRLAIMSKDGDWVLREDEEADWASVWPDVSRQIARLPLHEAHRIVTSRAEGLLPFVPPDGGAGA
jgi:hypothetical protein